MGRPSVSMVRGQETLAQHGHQGAGSGNPRTTWLWPVSDRATAVEQSKPDVGAPTTRDAEPQSGPGELPLEPDRYRK